jgi:hypothetical protein
VSDFQDWEHLRAELHDADALVDAEEATVPACPGLKSLGHAGVQPG